MVTREQLYRQIDDAHQELLHVSFEVERISVAVRYLHPEMSKDLAMIAEDMERCRKTIQGNQAHMINIDLQASHNHIGEVFKALLEP